MQTTTQQTTQQQRSRTGSPVDGLRAWLLVLDAMLRVIEQAAWETRNASEELMRAARGDLLYMKRRGRQLGVMPDQLARAAACGWVLTQIASSYRLHITRAAFTTGTSPSAPTTRRGAPPLSRRCMCPAITPSTRLP